MTSPSHYEILGLPNELQTGPITLPTLRNAYRRALLQNHPDKSSTLKRNNTFQKPKYTIDQISRAFEILSSAKSRAQYDVQLKLRPNTTGRAGNGKTNGFQTGVEAVDLDDLELDEASGTWYRSCRCGSEGGFEVREEDLEEAAAEGEVSVGCKGCSLWLKVLFGVVEEEAVKEEAVEEEATAGQDKPEKVQIEKDAG